MGVEECVVRDPPERIRVIAAGGPQIVGAAPNCRPEHCKGSVILALQRGPKGLHWNGAVGWAFPLDHGATPGETSCMCHLDFAGRTSYHQGGCSWYYWTMRRVHEIVAGRGRLRSHPII